MPILFHEDWRDEHGKWQAMPHTSTTNTSFLRTCSLFKKMGIKNYLFPLALYDPDLEFIDPHKLEENTPENERLRLKVQTESARNGWYFLREVLRIEDAGGDPVKFKLDRGNTAMAWCFFNGIDYTSTQPRQAQPLDALIRTPHGIETMGDMYVGKDILAPDGTVTKVIGVYPLGMRQVYRVTLSGGEIAECCDDHLWKVYPDSESDEFEILRLNEIMAGDPWVCIPVLSEDGSIVKKSISIIELIGKKFVQCIEVDHPDQLYVTNNSVITHNTGKEQPLDALILTQQGWVKMGDISLRDYVISPDGTISKVTGVYPQGIKDIYRVTLIDGRSTECGLSHLWKVYYSQDDKTGETISLEEILQKSQHIFIPVYDKSKKSTIRMLLRSVEYVGQKEAQCIMVDHPDHLYITDDYIVTHNTIGALGLTTWVLFSSGYRFQIGMMTKDSDLQQENVRRVKTMSENLPSWWVAKDKNHDVRNTERIYYAEVKTDYVSFVAQKDKIQANKKARGQSPPMVHFDELEYITNIGISFPTIMSSTSKARMNAKKNGKPHSIIITTTAGDPLTPECQEAMHLLKGAMPFTERLYDVKDNDELHSVVKAASPQEMILGVFSHLQLGYDNEWLRDIITRNRLSSDQVMRDYLNRRVSIQAKPIIPKETLAKISASQEEERWMQIVSRHFVIFWYVDKEVVESEYFKNIPIVVGCDSSEMIGRDATTLVGVDPRDLSVVFTFRAIEGNIQVVGSQIADLMIRFPKMILVPENKSSGTSFIDSALLILRENGYNPFKRIFNWVVNNRHEEEFAKYNINDMSLLDTQLKKYFGIKTDKSKRDELYSSVLLEAAAHGCHGVRDQGLIQELNTLHVRNGRVDHAVGGHDDLTIAYLLSMFFILNGKNHSVYGIEPGMVFSQANSSKMTDTSIKERQQLLLRERIEELESSLKYQNDLMIRKKVEADIRFLKSKIEEGTVPAPLTADELLRDPKRYSDPIAVQKSRKPVDSDSMESTLRSFLGLS